MKYKGKTTPAIVGTGNPENGDYAAMVEAAEEQQTLSKGPGIVPDDSDPDAIGVKPGKDGKLFHHPV